jgi:transposase-like protein
MSTMRAYTREFRESAVGLVLSEGLSIRKAADDLGMPYHTLHGWARAVRRSRRKPVQKVQPRTRIHGSLGYVSPEAFEAAARVGQDQAGCPRVLWKSSSRSGHGVFGAAITQSDASRYGWRRRRHVAQASLRSAFGGAWTRASARHHWKWWQP